MKTSKLIYLCAVCLITILPAAAQNRQEKKEKIEREVREAVDSNHYKINVDRMFPMRGSSKLLTSNYSVEIRNDSVFSYLPYFGVAYSIPYGGGKGLVFNAPLSEYKAEYHKKGKVKVDFKVRNEEDSYTYNLTIFPNGSTSIQVHSTNRQPISFQGNMELKYED